jgi:major type 1 subunit fimbrin (pilin)
MKKTLLTAALLTAFGVAATASKAASASDGTITFSGAVTGTTCTIKVNGGSASATVTLPTVQASDFSAAGTTTGFVPLTIALSGCSTSSGTAATEVRPYFEPASTLDTTTGYTNYLKNTATGTSAASGVDIMISNNNSGTTGALTLSGGEGAQNVTPVSLSGTTGATFSFYAAYISNAATVTPGSVSSTLVYDLDYK